MELFDGDDGDNGDEDVDGDEKGDEGIKHLCTASHYEG